MNWRRFVWSFAVSFFAILSALASLIFLMNPFGNLRPSLFGEHVIMDINQRYQYPALIRSRQFDSVVMGTSDARLLRPTSLEKVFGGHFANLALNAGTAWEQYRLADLFIHEVERPQLLLMAIDHAWCDQKATAGDTTFRGFPDWMYDNDSLNDIPYMLNSKSVETSFRRLGHLLRLKPARFVAGYEVFTPPDEDYDLIKAKRKLWKGKVSQVIEPVIPPYFPSTDEPDKWQFPALVWLDEILGRFAGDVVVAFMPVHVRAQPIPGSRMAAVENECKKRIVEIARRYKAPVIDFRIWSDITSTDSNYWDPLHYRESIAERIVSGIDRALSTRKDDPKGDWRYIETRDEQAASP